MLVYDNEVLNVVDFRFYEIESPSVNSGGTPLLEQDSGRIFLMGPKRTIF